MPMKSFALMQLSESELAPLPSFCTLLLHMPHTLTRPLTLLHSPLNHSLIISQRLFVWAYRTPGEFQMILAVI